MRTTLKTNFSLLLFAVVVLCGCSQKNVVELVQADESFNEGWKFVRIDNPDSIDEYQFLTADFTGMEDVVLPHTARIEPLTVKNQWQGICYYAKEFDVPNDGKMHSVKFEAAMNVADVWVNGVHTYTHVGGYLPFSVKLENVGATNILIRLDNRDNAITGPKPLKILDFCTYGGIYRNVWVESVDSLHITDAVEKGESDGGIFVHCSDINKKSATVNVRANVENASSCSKNAVFNFVVKNQYGEAVADGSVEMILEAGTDAVVEKSVVVKKPDLWSPDSPNLYTLETSVVNNGITVDSETLRFGIRDVKISPEGLVLNGKKTFLRGVNRHQEYPYVGYALSDEAQWRDARKIKDAGFDYVRASHYPPSSAFLDACDELGIFVLDAILGWQYFGDSLFAENSKQCSRDLIRRDRNHACVLAWELSINESRMPKQFMSDVNVIAHEEYPAEPCYTAGWIKGGYDIYLEARQHRHGIDTTVPMIVSEYGDWEYYAQNAGLNQDGWADLLTEERNSRQPRFSGEKRMLQQARNLQEAHNDNRSTHAFADGYWLLFDYNRGYADDIEYSGLMDITRLPKFSYYFFRSQRVADSAMVFIASYWQPEVSNGVRVFSNCEEVELFVDGQSVGRSIPDSNSISMLLERPPFSFDVNCEKAGTLKAVAYIDGKAVAEHEVRTPETPMNLVLKVDESGVAPSSNDVLLVYAEIQDVNGTVVPDFNGEVTFSVEGAMLQSPVVVNAEAGIATAVVRTNYDTGKICTVSALSGEMKSSVNFNY